MNKLCKLTTSLALLSGLFIGTGCYRNQEKNDQNPSRLGYVNIEKGKLFYQKMGSGDPIIMVHGGPGLDQSYLMPQMLTLAQDHEVIFYDQRGSGHSLESDLSSQYVSLDQFTEDLEKLRLGLGLRKFTLVGHSWGGLLSMNYAIKYPEKVHSLILLNSVPADYKGQKSFIDHLTLKTKPIKHKISALFDDKEFSSLDTKQINQLYRDLFSVYFKNPTEVSKLTLDMNKKSALGGFKVMALMSKTSWIHPTVNLFPALRKLTIPTLIIHGNQDIIPEYTAKEIKEAIPHSQIVYLNNCGHFPYIEKPDDLFKSIRSFLSKKKDK